ncbi:recombinase family protein [Streptomyces mirabilis]|uniref:recombinase family protein n=1 Tax=Streptomyces mirabilis TaxID=68239 RepID=UPI00368115A1
MELTPDQPADAVERYDCPKCEASAGSPCRTRGGKVATKYHTARFILVPALKEDLDVAVPASRHPGRPWQPGAAQAPAPVASSSAPTRIGYARCNTATQELQSQLDALAAARCRRVFSEKISTRIKHRPDLEKALQLATDIKEAAPDQSVILTVHEMKRLARNAAELMLLSARLQETDVQLELLTGPLTGVYDPNGMGSMLFAILAVAAQLGRNYIREKTLEGQQTAAASGNHGGRPKVFDDDMLTFARALQAKGTPVPRDQEEAGHQGGQERRPQPLAGLRLPRPGRRRTGDCVRLSETMILLIVNSCTETTHTRARPAGAGIVGVSVGGSHPVHLRPRSSRADAAQGVQEADRKIDVREGRRQHPGRVRTG